MKKEVQMQKPVCKVIEPALKIQKESFIRVYTCPITDFYETDNFGMVSIILKENRIRLIWLSLCR